MIKQIFRKIIVALLRIEAKLILKKYKPKIVGITGTVGKTSAKEAVALALTIKFNVRKSEKSYNSELGVPLTIIGAKSAWNNFCQWLLILVKGVTVFFKEKNYPQWLILEMGVDRPKDMENLRSLVKPNVAVITAVGEIPVHVESFKNVDELAEEKSKIIKNLNFDDYVILNGDDPKITAVREKTNANVITFGWGEKNDLIASNYHLTPSGINFKVDYRGSIIPVRLHNVFGRQFVYTALIAMAVGLSQDLNLVEVAEALLNFKSLPGRLNLIEGIKNSFILDDTYNSSPLAVAATLDALIELPGERKIAVLGDMLELGKFTIDEHKKIGRMVKEKNIDLLFTVGPRAKFIADEARQVGFKPENIFEFSTADNVKMEVQNKMQEKDLVLVKGSQSMRLEKIVEEIMAHPELKEQLLVRQEKEWLNKR